MKARGICHQEGHTLLMKSTFARLAHEVVL